MHALRSPLLDFGSDPRNSARAKPNRRGERQRYAVNVGPICALRPITCWEPVITFLDLPAMARKRLSYTAPMQWVLLLHLERCRRKQRREIMKSTQRIY
jgi:hypothetical protein